jgi:protein involved in polysaccharide export with SLBB domain
MVEFAVRGRTMVTETTSSVPKWIIGYLLLVGILLLPRNASSQNGGGIGSAGGGISGTYGMSTAGSYGAAPGGAGAYGVPSTTGSFGAAPGTAIGGALPGAMPAAGGQGGVNGGMFPLANPAMNGSGAAGISSTQIHSLLNSPQAQAILNNPAALAALSQKFGISQADIQNLAGQLASGTLSQDQMNQLACRFAAIQASPTELASMASALGLNPQQIAQFQNSAACNNQQNPQTSQVLQTSQSPTSPLSSGQQPVQLPQQTSAIEANFHALDIPGQLPLAPDLSQLTQFGYSLFAQPVSTFAPITNVPVGDDYIIGPGDELVLLEWGRINETLSLVVDRDGSVQVPQIGPIQVAGLTFAQAKKLIEDRLNGIEGVTANVTMGELRTIQVFVVGQVNQPGAYTVSSLSRISNVLQQAGGISKVGSLRQVELKRHNQLISVLDLYDLLLRGDSSHDLRLENNDVIFVPVIGKVVAVAGDVKVPAIYEVSSSPSIRQVLGLAGGVTAFGYAEHVQVERVENHQRTIVLDLNLDQLGLRSFAIRDGDLIKVYPVLPDHKNTVTLAGNVHRPGEYQWYSGMRVSDLIRSGEGLLPHTYFSYALIKRMIGIQKYIHYVPVDLDAALAGGEDNQADLPLQELDEVQIFSQDELRDLPHVTIVGEVRDPGDYPLTEQMRLSDLIYQAGGFKDDANRNNAELARTQVGPDSKTLHTYMSIDLVPVMSGDTSRDLLLKNNDQVYIQIATNWHLPESVQLVGRVARPGPYVIRPGEQLSSLLLRCGGLLPDAFPQGIVLIRQSVQQLEQQRIDEARARLSEQLAQYSLTLSVATASNGNNSGGLTAATGGIATLQQLLASASNEQAEGRVVVHFNSLEQLAGSPDDVVVEDQDSITIPKRPSSVAVLGQVNNPTAIVARPGFTVADYLYKAGGATKNGDVDGLMVIKADGSVLTQEGIEHGPRESLFPLLPLVSGGIMGRTLTAGDTIYVPDNLADIPKYLSMSEKKDIAQIVANSAQGLAVVGILASQL